MTADEVKEARAEVYRLMGSLHPSSDTPADVRWFHQGLLGGLASRLVDDLERYVGRTETFSRDIGQEPIYRVDRYPATDRRPKPTADLVELLDLLGLSWKLEKDRGRTPLELFHDCILAVRELVDFRAKLLEERRQLQRQVVELQKTRVTNFVDDSSASIFKSKPVQGCAICTDDPSSNIGCERHPVPR